MFAPAPTQLPFTSGAAPAARRPRLRRWAKRLLPPLVLLLAAGWFAPAVVAKTELRNTLARRALADVRGSVEVGGASLGWLSPVELRDVTVKDAEGRTIASVPKITSERSLVALARHRADPGGFTVERPTLTVVCEKDSTNVEGAFAEYLKDGPAPAGPTRTPVRVTVVGGTLTIVDAAGGTSANVEGIDATAAVPASREEPVAVHLTAATGSLDVNASVGASGTAKLVGKDFPLDMLAPLLKRVDPGLSVAGAASADLRLSWGADAKGQRTAAAAGSVSGKGLAVSAPGLGGDRLRFESVRLPLDVELAGRNVRVRQFDLTCDAGAVSVKGLFDPEHAADDVLAQAGVSVTANVEVAKLVAQLPRLVRLKPGTELREGRLDVTLTSAAGPTGTAWQGTVGTSALKGVRDGKPVAWEKPLHAEFVARYEKGQFPTFDKLVCTSDFVALNAASKPDTLLLSANVYLGKLAERLRDFVDLDGWALDGTAFASFAGARKPDGAFVAELVVRLTDFAVMDRSGRGLREAALEAKVNATGVLPVGGAARLATASAKLTAGGDALDLTLLEPVGDVRALSTGSAEVHLSGQLETWKARAGAAVPIPAFGLTGAVDLRGKAKLAADRVTVDRLAVTLTNAKMDRWIALDEPTLSGVGDLAFTRANRTATFTKLTITSDTLKVADGTLAFELPEKGDVVVSGSGPCVADLNRLGRTVRLYPDANGPDALHGTGSGPAKFRTSGDTTTFGGELAVVNFGYGPKEHLVWSEPTLRLEADGKYEGAAQAVTLTSAKAERPGLALDVAGALSKLETTRDVRFTGNVRYEWEKLTPLLKQFVGSSFAATGTGSRGFTLSGQLEPNGPTPAAPRPPAPVSGSVTLKPPGAAAPKPAPAAAGGAGALAALDGQAAVGWQSLSAFGFDLGASELSVKLTHGVATVAPITATFGGGKVTLAPTLDLASSPFAVTLAKGMVIDHAKLTPAATAGALGYALPAIANSTNAEGELSVAIDDGNRLVPGDPAQTRAAGGLVIHKATVGLSPVLAQVANLIGAKATETTVVSNATVPVRVEGGRVYHANFPLRIAGTTFHTSGSVGFDDTLDLVVEVPLPKDFALLKSNPAMQKAVGGKMLKVPLKGTLSRPELNPKALNDALMALARDGAKEAGRDLLDGELKKLIPGLPGGTKP